MRALPLLLVALTALPVVAQPKQPIDKAHAAKMAAGLKLFKQSVRRTLTGRCLKCHGGEETESEFSLATRKALLAGGSGGKAIIFGKSARSRMLLMMQHKLKPHMPADGAKLSPREIKAVAQWIDLGAPYDTGLNQKSSDPAAWTKRVIGASEREYWAFKPLSHPSVPRIKLAWVQTPIDAFVARQLRKKNLPLNQRATPRSLLRRVYLGITGLPPTPRQVTEYLSDRTPGRYERLIDRLLASPRLGEKWARHWLDVARFAESYGFEHDTDRKFAFYYRDFVIKALNANMPYDKFVRWQLAGDEIEPSNPAALIATGFLGAGVFPTQITKNEVERTRYDAMDDMLATVGTSMLGLTIGCARCHDHKFDAIPQADYYRMLATFTTTVRSEIKVDLSNWLGTKKKNVQTIMICGEGHKPVRLNTQGKDFFNSTYFLRRGDTDQKVAAASQGFLQVLMTKAAKPKKWIVNPPSHAKKSYRRYSFARWITDTDRGAGHLLARVIVNRLWYHHFGRGLVNTPNDFGRQGKLPSHPQLLDWLAGELIRQGWDLKAMHRLILTSSTFQQSHFSSKAVRLADPSNRWYVRFDQRRLEAEVIRDTILAVSGELRTEMYGKGTLNVSHQRRSIYFQVKRSKLIPMMQLFDAPEPLVSIGNRPSTTIAPQALLFMNSKLVRRSSQAFARRVIRESKSSQLPKLVDLAYMIALARHPDKAEKTAAVSFLTEQQKTYKKEPLVQALTDYCQVILGLNEFVYP